MVADAHFSTERRLSASGAYVETVSRAQLVQFPHWVNAFSQCRKDHRYYELIEDTICPELDYRYLVISNRNDSCAIQPFFLVNQDLLAGLGARGQSLIQLLRKLWPGFMRLRILMVGCAAGEGHLDGADEALRRENVHLLDVCLREHAREQKARLIVFKEFMVADREALRSLTQFGYRRVPSLPAVRLSLGYASFDEYTRNSLSRNARMHLRRALRASAPPAVELEVAGDISSFIDDAYPLYLQVYQRSHVHFEKLTKEFFCELGRRMPDKVRFFLWRQNNRLVAFSTCMIEGDALCAEYLGLDYSVALDLHLYYRVFHDEVSWAIANNYKWYRSGQVGYDPKLHLRFRLEPLDLYIRSTANSFNVFFRWLLPLIEPMRHHPLLRKFPNYSEL